MATYSGQNMGAARLDRVKKGVRDILPLSLGVNLVLGIAMALFSTPLTSIFASPQELQEVLPYSRQMMMTQGFMKWVLGPLFIYRNALQGMGDTTTPMLSGFLELGMRILAAYLLVRPLQFLGLCNALCGNRFVHLGVPVAKRYCAVFGDTNAVIRAWHAMKAEESTRG